MRSKGFDGMNCSVAAVMGAIGDRWGMLILRDLLLGLSRYEDLRRSTDITNATLSDRLKTLEDNGLVERRQYQSRPDRFEYRLTARGRDIGLVTQAMVQVGDRWNLQALDGPPMRFIDARTGGDVRLAPVDAQTGAAVAPGQIAVRPGEGADEVMLWRLSHGGAPSAVSDAP